MACYIGSKTKDRSIAYGLMERSESGERTSMKEMVKRCLSLGFSLSVVVLMRLRGRNVSTPAKTVVAKLPEVPLAPLPVPTPLPLIPPSSAFYGTVIRDGSRFALRKEDGALCGLDSAGRAWSFEGEDVMIAGYVIPESKLLHVCAIEAIDGLRAEAV